jgi:hypothetical protein
MVFLDVGVGDSASIGVGVDQQDLTARGGGLERQVDGHGRPARAALRAPHGGQDPPPVAVRLDRGFPQVRRLLGGIGVGEVGLGVQRGAGPVNERSRRIGVRGHMQQPELAEASLAVLVAVRDHTDHRESRRGQPGQRVPVQPSRPGGDHRHLSLAGGGHGQQVTQVIAAVQPPPAPPGRPEPILV